MDTEDWESEWADRALEAAEPPEDWSGSVDVESTEDTAAGSDISGDESGGLRASSLDGNRSVSSNRRAPGTSVHGYGKRRRVGAVGQHDKSAFYLERHCAQVAFRHTAQPDISRGLLEQCPCDEHTINVESAVRNRCGRRLSGCPACGQWFT